MSQKPETLFIQKFKKAVGKRAYMEKTANPFRGGCPDTYMELPNGTVIWIEFKWLDKLPRKHTLKLTELQYRWLSRAHSHYVYSCVVLGWKEGRNSVCALFDDPEQWKRCWLREELVTRKLTLEEVTKILTK